VENLKKNFFLLQSALLIANLEYIAYYTSLEGSTISFDNSHGYKLSFISDSLYSHLYCILLQWILQWILKLILLQVAQKDLTLKKLIKLAPNVSSFLYRESLFWVEKISWTLEAYW